jgi:ubiquinone/menaquinone biosynthesis C-methylase UbiE
MQLRRIREGASILDAGAGEKQYQKFCSHLKYTSQDIANYSGQGNEGLHTGTWEYGDLDIVSDIIDIPVPDSSYECILCTEVFEHIPNPILAIKEFARILKSDGILILTAPFNSLTHFEPYHFYSGFSKFFYQKCLAEQGFEVIECTPNGNYFEYLAQEVRRLEAVSYKYTGSKFSYVQRKSIDTIISYLGSLSHVGDSSSELLCFGYHVVAKKI